MKKKILGLLLAAVFIITLTVPSGIEAASYKTKIKKLVNSLGGYEYALLSQLGSSYYEDGDVITIKFTDAEMAKAAAYTGFEYNGAKKLKTDTDWEMWSEYLIPSSVIKTYSKRLFGKTITYKKLPKNNADDAYGFMDAYINENGKPAMFCWEGETETSFETYDMTVKKSGSTYTCTEEIFYGYWGEHSEYPDKRNFRITYTLKKKKGSYYGFVLTGMKIERI